MQRVGLFLFLVFALSPLKSEDAPKIPAEYPKVKTDDLPANAAVLPMRILDDRIFVPLILNGKYLVNALVDTGSGNTLINKHWLKLKNTDFELTGTESLNFPYVGDLGGQRATFKFLTLGKRTLPDAKLLLINQEPGQPLSQLEGLLGMDVLGQTCFTLDFPNQRLILWPAISKLPDPEKNVERAKLPLIKGKELDDPHLYVAAQVNSKVRAIFCLDTGAFEPTLFTQGRLEVYGFDLEKLGKSPIQNRRLGFTDSSFEFPCVIASFDSLAFERMTFTNVWGKVIDSSKLNDARLRGFLKNCGSLIGTTFFKRLSALHIDWPAQAVYFDKFKDEK
jgi:hypothetical protein